MQPRSNRRPTESQGSTAPMPAMLGTSIAALMLVGSVAGQTTYPLTYTVCGVDHTIAQAPSRVVTLNQGVTEFMLAMGLADKMVGHAYLDDAIWPRYKSEYDAIAELASGYPTESQIAAVNPDFILGSYRSAFRQKTCNADTGKCRGIFNVSVGGGMDPCNGTGSDWFGGETSAANPTSYSTCRPQLHATGIGTWLEPVSCEDPAFKPAGGATEQTVYAAIRQIGKIFDVATVAEKLVAEIKEDFDIAERAVAQVEGTEIKSVWLDCVECCKDSDGNYITDQVFVGAGGGAPNLIMKESGLTNVFASESGSWSCVEISELVKKKPDVVVVVDASWDSAIEKIKFMHNHSTLCNENFVQRGEYITIPFSASTLGPRNGAAALDMASAAIHMVTGGVTMDFKSGVSFPTHDFLKAQTAGLRCPYEPPAAATPAPAPPPPPPPVVEKETAPLSGGAIAGIVIGSLVGAILLGTVIFLIVRERQGEPVFMPLINSEEPPQTLQVPSTKPGTVGYEMPVPAPLPTPIGVQPTGTQSIV